MKKVILDTDIGTDADDAVCLTYLLNQPECDLLGITTVGPDPITRAKIAGMLCKHFGHSEIPIAAGCGHPIVPSPCWYDHGVTHEPVLEQWPPPRQYQAGEAQTLLRQIICEHPHEVILLTVGPLSNAALLACADPETAGMIDELVVMGGHYPNDPNSPRTECNFMLDAAASGAVFSRPWNSLRAAGTETTSPTAISAELMEDKLGKEGLEPLLECCKHWVYRDPNNDSPSLGMHDPLTAALIFKPELCDYERGTVYTRLLNNETADDSPFDNDKLSVFSLFRADPEGPHQIAKNARKTDFLEHLFETILPE